MTTTQRDTRLLRTPLLRFKQHRTRKGRTTMAEGNGATYAAEITDLGDRIAKLTITQAVQLKDYLKEKYKIEPAAGGVVVAQGGGGGGATAAPAPEAKKELTVSLD